MRRLVRIVGWIGTAIVGLLALALIVSQTPWFRDWIRRTMVREAKQYLNGELSIGGLGGNLFFGITLSDVAVDVSGDRVVAVKTVAVDYSIFQLISEGIAIDRIELTSPAIHLVRDQEGWNLRGLVKPQRREADREGPRRPVSLSNIILSDGVVTIDDKVGSTSYRLPRRIDDVDLQARFEYAPVHFTVELGQLHLRAGDPGDPRDPKLVLGETSGSIAVRDDNLYLERLSLKTGESALTIEGVVEQYLRARVLKLATSGTISLPEIGQFLPAVEGYPLHPALTLKTDGAMDRLAVDLDVRSEAGRVRGQVTADVLAPDLRVAGPVQMERLNLAPILKKPAQRSDITGDATVDLSIPSQPAGVPVADRIRGRFTFRGPHVAAMGYQARQVQATGAFEGAKITLASARVNAYGGRATTTGTIVLPQRGRPVAYDLKGSAEHVDLRRLPASVRAPKLDTDLSLASYHVRGTGPAVTASAALHRSVVEGATIGEGTVVEVEAGRGLLSYAARGSVAGLNVRRVGAALELPALDKPLYDGRVNGSFDLKASGTTLATMSLSAIGALNDTSIAGTHLSEMAYRADIAEGGLAVYAKGGFDQLNPAVATGRKALEGNVNGRVDGTFRIRDLAGPVSPATMAAEGSVTLTPSLLGGVQIASADVEGRYDAEVADIKRLQVKGPAVTVDASGRLALDRTSASDLKYHIDATDIREVGEIAGQKGLDGTLVLDGTVSGNAASLKSSGTLVGNGLQWGEHKALDLKSQYTVTAADLDFVNARVEAKTDATFVVVSGRQLNQVTATTTYERQTLEFATKIQESTRELEATGKAILHPDHQEVHLPQLALRTEGIEWKNAAGSEPVVQYGKGQLTLKDVRLERGDQALTVNGSMALKGEETSGTIEAQARNVDIAELERLLLQNRGFTGRLTADAKISGTFTRPIVDGHVEVRDGGFRNYRYESLVADVDFGDRRIALDATLQQGPGVAITARGTVPTSLFAGGAGDHVAAATAEDAIDLRIETASMNLGVIQGFTSAVTNVAGTLQADVRVTGSGRDPHLVGFIEIRDGAFAVPGAGTSYTGLDTRVDLETDVVRIRRFEILDENGEQLAVAGQLAVHERQVGAVDITLESQNFEIIDNELGDLGVGTNLKISGELLRPRIEGDVRIAAGRVEVDRMLRLFWDPYRVEELPEVVSAERVAETSAGAAAATRHALAQAGQAEAAQQKKEEAPARPAGFFDRVALDVRLEIPDNLILRGRRIRPGGPTRASIGDINVTVGGDLAIRKNPDQPMTFAGVVTTVRGTYKFQGRDFELARGGTIRFTGEPDPDPVLDVTATRQIPDTGVEARVHITGTLKTPELQLSSTPALDESDVLSLILFNQPVNELGTGERASLAATAGGIATGFIAQPLGESIGRALDLDLFEISTTAEGDSLGGGITVGEQIGDRMFLKLRQLFGERAYSEFILEYRLSDFLRLQASAVPEASDANIRQRRVELAGINLIFFFSY